MEILKFQKYYIRSLYKSNDNIEITNIKSNFRNRFNIKLKLTKEDIYKEKYIVFGNINKLNLLELCNKISTTDIKVNCKIVDIFYDYTNIKNNVIKREEKVIFITTENMEAKLKDNNINNYFIDVTYKIVPLRHKNKYKLMTITGTDKTNNKILFT